MSNDSKCLNFVVATFDGFRLLKEEYFDSYGEAVEAFDSIRDDKYHCILSRVEFLEEFFPDDLNLYWHSLLLPSDDNHDFISGRKKENEK